MSHIATRTIPAGWGMVPVWSWRQAIAKTKAEPLTKLLCFAIANYMTDCGKGCWPSIRTLAADTGMSERSVTNHLKLAHKVGLLAVTRRRFGDGRLGGYFFHPHFPDELGLPADNDIHDQGGIEPYNAPGRDGKDLDNGPPASGSKPPASGAAGPPARGAGQVELSNLENYPKEKENRLSSDKSDACASNGFACSGFDEWYQAYPRHEGRGQAVKAYKTASKKVDAGKLLAGARQARERYADTERRYIPLPATWLNGERWLDEWSADEPRPAKRKQTIQEMIDEVCPPELYGSLLQ